MKDKTKVLAEYEIFGSKLRGTKVVEEKIVSILKEKETDENLNKLAGALLPEWECMDENVSHLRLSFSKFEEKLEKKKAELKIQVIEKEKKKVGQSPKRVLQK